MAKKSKDVSSFVAQLPLGHRAAYVQVYSTTSLQTATPEESGDKVYKIDPVPLALCMRLASRSQKAINPCP